MTIVRDIMSPEPTFCSADATAAEAAQMMADNDIGAVPVCGSDGRLSGVVPDRDLALTIVAEGRDANEIHLRDLTDGSEVVTVVDGTKLVGMVSQADIARFMPEARIGDLVDAISSAPANN